MENHQNMDTKITKDMVEHHLISTCAKEIIINFFMDCFPQLEDLFLEESVKHYLFHCTFRYDTANACHIIQCERDKKRKPVNPLNKDEFKKIYQKQKTNHCIHKCSTCMDHWRPIKEVNIENLDLCTFKRISECTFIANNEDFQKYKTSFENIISFRNNAAHGRPIKDFRNCLLEAASLVKDEEVQSNIKDRIEEWYLMIAGILEIRICNENANRRRSFLNDMLLALSALEKEKRKFAYHNLGFYFEDNPLSAKDQDISYFIKKNQNSMDNINTSLLLHTVCYFGIENVLEQILTEEESKILPVINNVDFTNQNILMNACEKKHWNIAEKLLRKYQKKWNLYQKDCNGKTTFSLCLNNKKMIGLFIELGLNIKGLSGFNSQPIEQKSTNTIDGLKMHDPHKDVNDQQSFVKENMWIALSFQDNKTLPSLLKSLDNKKWEEKNYLDTDNYQIQLLLKCYNIKSFELKALSLPADSKDFLEKQIWDEPIDRKYVLQCKIGDTNYEGLCIHKCFEPVLVFPCQDDYRQEYILANMSKDDEQEIIGNITKMDEHLCAAFEPQNDFLTLQRFYVAKRPRKREIVLDPFQENVILLDCGGMISFPENCIEHPQTVEVWEKKMESPPKDSKIKAGTDMIYITSKQPLQLKKGKTVKFLFNGQFPTPFQPEDFKLLKVSKTVSGGNCIKVSEENLEVKGNTLQFEVGNLCGKCVVLCGQERSQDLDEILVMEVKLLYLNYKKCTALFGIDKITNGMTTAHIFLLIHNENLLQESQFADYQKKENLIIRDFCTFHIQCKDAFKCEKEPSLHVQFCSEENHIAFKIEVRNNIQVGTFEVEGFPDIDKFEIEFPVTLSCSMDQSSNQEGLSRMSSLSEERQSYKITTRLEDLAKPDHETLGFHLNGICHLLLGQRDVCQRYSLKVKHKRAKSAGARLLHTSVDKDNSRTIGMLRKIITGTSEGHEIVSTLDNWIGTAKYYENKRIEDLETHDHTLLADLIDKYNKHEDIASEFRLTERDSRNVHDYLPESPGERFLHILVGRDSSIAIKNLIEMLLSANNSAKPEEQQIINTTVTLLNKWIGHEGGSLDSAMQNLSINQNASDITAPGFAGAEGGSQQNTNLGQTKVDTRRYQTTDLGNVMGSPSDSN